MQDQFKKETGEDWKLNDDDYKAVSSFLSERSGRTIPHANDWRLASNQWSYVLRYMMGEVNKEIKTIANKKCDGPSITNRWYYEERLSFDGYTIELDKIKNHQDYSAELFFSIYKDDDNTVKKQYRFNVAPIDEKLGDSGRKLQINYGIDGVNIYKYAKAAIGKQGKVGYFYEPSLNHPEPLSLALAMTAGIIQNYSIDTRLDRERLNEEKRKSAENGKRELIP